MASTSPSEQLGPKPQPAALRGARAADSPWAAIVLVLLFALAFYLWTADTSIPFSQNSNDVYDLLARAFLHGHTYLPIKVPAGLLHLSHPYNPADNSLYSDNPLYHDLSLDHGHFYSSWGPTPLILFLPFRLFGLEMSQSFAAALFGWVGLVCATALLRVLVQRLVPGTPRWFMVVATVGLALTNAVPFILRRPAQYEVAINAGYCFEMAGLLLVITAALATPTRRWRLAWGSLCLGLAVGGRPTLVVGGAVALAAAIYAVRRRRERWTVFAYALAPFLLFGVLLMAYNQVRFGSFGEFGEHYQLAGLDTMTKPADQLAYIPPGLFSYLLVPARLALTFPHAFLMTSSYYPFSLPAGYAGTVAGGAPEPAGGMLTTMPITLLLLALPIVWWRRRDGERATLLIAAGFTAVGLLIIILLSYALWGTTQRYEVDFATLCLIPAFLIWALLISRHRGRPWHRGADVVVGIALTGFGAAVGTAVSFTGYYDLLRLNHPGTFDTLEDITSPFATLATMIGGKAVIARVDTGALPIVQSVRFGTFTDAGADAWLGTGPVTITVISPRAENVALTAAAVPGPGAPPRSALVIAVNSGAQRSDVPLIGLVVRMPVHLNWGLNRITLSLAEPKPSSAEELALNNLELSS
jgi:hypothetical protein